MDTSQSELRSPQDTSPSKATPGYLSLVSTEARMRCSMPTIAKQLKELVDRADRDPDIHAVVFTGTHPDRFLSHSDVRWLQKGGTGFPPINTRIARLVARTARLINRVPIVRTLAGMTRLKTLLQLDSFHATFLKMNASGTIFIAALNGSALAVGAELAWACDLRIMADGDYRHRPDRSPARTHPGWRRLSTTAPSDWYPANVGRRSRRQAVHTSRGPLARRGRRSGAAGKRYSRAR